MSDADLQAGAGEPAEPHAPERSEVPTETHDGPTAPGGSGSGSSSAGMPEGTGTAPPRGPHRWAVRSMLALATLLAIIGIFAVWANRQLLDNSYWTATNTRLLENPAIQSQLSAYLTEQLYANVDVAGELRNELPSELKPLAAPAASGLRTVVEKGIGLALERPRVQELWKTANEVTHQQFVNLVENKGKVLRTPGGGAVILDLRPIVSNVASRVGLPASTAEKLPANIAQIKIVSSKNLEAMQTAVRILRSLAIVLPLLVLLLFAGAIGLSPGRRPRALLNVGLVCIGSGLVVLVARSIIGSKVVDTLSSTESVRPAASAAWSIGTSVLFEVAVGIVFIGALVALAGLLAGRSRPATATRRAMAPYLRDRPEITFGIAGLLLLILFLWGPIAATQKLAGIILIVVLTLVGVQMLRRQTAQEFPDAHAGALEFFQHGLSDLRGSVSRGGASLRESIGGSSGQRSSGGSVDQLERLAALHDSGSLSDDEFAAAKRELMGG